jgi:hypothetical protein
MVARVDGYMAYESQLINITRTPNPKIFTAYLRKQSELPNTRETQLILRQVYSANPFEGSAQSNLASADRLMKGGRYYLAFDLVLNKNADMNTVASFSVSPSTVNSILADSNLYIIDVYSIDNSMTIKSETKGGQFFVDASAAQETYAKAKQANILFGSQRGPQVIPIIVVLGTDMNARGPVHITYQAESNMEYGFEQRKEFNIGEKFCFADCPQFLFDTEIKWNTREYAPIESIETLLYDGSFD